MVWVASKRKNNDLVLWGKKNRRSPATQTLTLTRASSSWTYPIASEKAFSIGKQEYGSDRKDQARKVD